jgi:hypothetical protein
MKSNFSKSGVIAADDSDLRQTIRSVLQEDNRRNQTKCKSDLQARRNRNDLTVTEVASSIMNEDEQASDVASQNSLRSYPGTNGPTGSREYPRPDIANSHLYYSNQEALAPKPEPNVADHGDPKQWQWDLIDASNQLCRVYSRIIDNRERLSVSDVTAVKSFMRNLMTALTSD